MPRPGPSYYYRHRPPPDFGFPTADYSRRNSDESQRKTVFFSDLGTFLAFCIPARVASFAAFTISEGSLALRANHLELGLLPLDPAQIDARCA